MECEFDIHLYDGVMRLALVPFNPTVGDVAGNAAGMAALIRDARGRGADLVVLPELALSGYPPKDLLMQEGFVEACVASAKKLGEEESAGITLVFGVPLPVDTKRPRGPIANALVAYRDGRMVDYYDKRLLPTYDVFDEDRYFTPGTRGVVIDVPIRTRSVSEGGAGRAENQAKAHADASGSVVRVGLAICEDLWKGEDAGFSSRYRDSPDPVAELIAAGARIIISPSASPFVLGKHEKHRAICSAHAARHGCWVASVNQAGANDELIFDGHAMVFAPGGELVASGGLFEERGVEVWVGGGGEDARSPSLGPPPSLEDSRHLPRWKRGRSSGAAANDERGGSERLLFLALRTGIRDYLRKTGFKDAIIGLSGGIDSALTAALAVAALGREHVRGVAMPGVYSSEHSKHDAYDLAKRLGIECLTIPIDPPVRGFREVVDPALASQGFNPLGASLPDLAEENLQSRVRGTLLMALSNRTGAIVLTTGNKSELAVGYCTLYGDMNGGLAVLSDVTKHWVYALSRWINANFGACGFDGPPIPERSIDKAPSAELRPNQTDQDSLPAYPVLDEILARYVEERQSPARIIAETGFDEAMVRKMVRLIDLSEYKRKQAAIGLKVTTVAFGSGRRWPIAQGWR